MTLISCPAPIVYGYADRCGRPLVAHPMQPLGGRPYRFTGCGSRICSKLAAREHQAQRRDQKPVVRLRRRPFPFLTIEEHITQHLWSTTQKNVKSQNQNQSTKRCTYPL